MPLSSNHALAIIKLTCAVQENINSLIVKGVNGSEIHDKDVNLALGYINRLKHEIGTFKSMNKCFL